MVHKIAKNELKKDFCHYVSRANSGDSRCRYAAIEIYDRLAHLGEEQSWLSMARKAFPYVSEIEKLRSNKGE